MQHLIAIAFERQMFISVIFPLAFAQCSKPSEAVQQQVWWRGWILLQNLNLYTIMYTLMC